MPDMRKRVDKAAESLRISVIKDQYEKEAERYLAEAYPEALNSRPVILNIALASACCEIAKLRKELKELKEANQ